MLSTDRLGVLAEQDRGRDARFTDRHERREETNRQNYRLLVATSFAAEAADVPDLHSSRPAGPIGSDAAGEDFFAA